MSYSQKEFSLYLKRCGLAAASIDHYLKYLNYLLSHIQPLTLDNVMSFLNSLLDRECKPSYYNGYVKVLRKWDLYCGTNTFKSLELLKEKPAPKNILSTEEIEKFLALPAPPNTPKELWEKWNLFWTLGFYCGLRLAECQRIRFECLDFSRSVIRVEEGKTGFRQVPIPPHLKEYLAIYSANKTGYIFTTRTGKLFNDGIWNDNWHKRLKRLGITKDVKPYSVRDSKITRLVEGDVNFFKIMKFAGHKDPKTTKRYVDFATIDLQSANTKDALVAKDLSLEQRKMMVYEYALSLGVNPRDL